MEFSKRKYMDIREQYIQPEFDIGDWYDVNLLNTFSEMGFTGEMLFSDITVFNFNLKQYVFFDILTDKVMSNYFYRKIIELQQDLVHLPYDVVEIIFKFLNEGLVHYVDYLLFYIVPYKPTLIRKIICLLHQKPNKTALENQLVNYYDGFIDFGSGLPISSKTAVEMEENAYASTRPQAELEGWKLIIPYTSGVKAYRKDNNIVLAIRGSADLRDVYADVRIANGSLNKSPRYAEDKEYILRLQKQYSPTAFSYYGVGHSLGGAICDLLLNDGLIKEAISFNPAVERKYFNNSGNYRIYNEDDLLYKMMGQYTKNHEVRKNKKSLINKLAGLTKVGKVKNALDAHKLSKFEGGNFFTNT